MKKMGKIDTQDDFYNFKESEKDRIKKMRKYYKKELENLGLNFDILSSKCEKEILDFFQDLSEKKEEKIQIINSIKNSNSKGLKIILNNLKEFQDKKAEFEKEWDKDLFKLDYLSNEIELLNMRNGQENIVLVFNLYTIIILRTLISLFLKYYRDSNNNDNDNVIFSYSYIEEFLIKHLIFSWENIYFYKNIPPEKREMFYSTFKRFLLYLEANIVDNNMEYFKFRYGNIEQENLDSKKIIYSFIELNNSLNSLFNNKVNFEFKVDTKEIKKTFEATIFAVTVDNINFKDLKTKNLKKDNLFEKRIKDIEQLMIKLDSLEGGPILKKNKETLELLYLIFYKNKNKIKIKGLTEKEKNFFTLIRYVLEGKDKDNKILKILAKYVRAGMFIANSKENELKYLLELELLLENLFRIINSGTNPTLITSNLHIALTLFSSFYEREKIFSE